MSAAIFSSCLKEEIVTNNTSTVVPQNNRTLEGIQSTTATYISTQNRLNESDLIAYRTEGDREATPEEKWNHDVAVGVDCVLSGIGLNDAAEIGLRASSVYSISVGGPEGNDLTRPEPMLYAANPLDIYGIMHVDLLHDQLAISKERTFDGSVPNHSNYVTYAQDYSLEHYGITARELPDLTVKNIDKFLERLETTVNFSLVYYIETKRTEGLMPSLEADILSSYFSALEASRSFEAFYTYSTSVENDIIKSDYRLEVKELLLFTMATTRHDVQYWTVNS